jgi:sugar porter (SP) family MFS transporter
MVDTKEHSTFFALFVLLVASFGGILYGYHTVILSGILKAVGSTFHLTQLDEGFLVSIILLGGLVGALFAGGAADKWGRKKVLIITALAFCIGTLVQVVTPFYSLLIAGRFFTGIAVGVTSVVSPLYLSEIAPPHHRGAFVCTYQLFLASGILLAYGVDIAFNQVTNWNTVFYIGLIPSLLQFLALFFLPETPGWLMKHAQKKEALETLSHLREDIEWKDHVSEMQLTAAPKKKKAFLEPYLKRLMTIGVILSTFQQITGVNTVFYYAPKIFEISHENSTFPLLVTFGIGLVNVLATIISVVFLDKFGRRIFLLYGTLAMVVGQILLSFATISPITGIVGAVVYVIGFALGLGPITWVLLSEIYPLSIRGKAVGLALFANWLFNYLVSLTFLLLIEKLGMSLTFALYGFISLLCLIFVYFYIPETKGKSLEEIEFLAAQGKL